MESRVIRFFGVIKKIKTPAVDSPKNNKRKTYLGISTKTTNKFSVFTSASLTDMKMDIVRIRNPNKTNSKVIAESYIRMQIYYVELIVKRLSNARTSYRCLFCLLEIFSTPVCMTFFFNHVTFSDND